MFPRSTGSSLEASMEKMPCLDKMPSLKAVQWSIEAVNEKQTKHLMQGGNDKPGQISDRTLGGYHTSVSSSYVSRSSDESSTNVKFQDNDCTGQANLRIQKFSRSLNHPPGT